MCLSMKCLSLTYRLCWSFWHANILKKILGFSLKIRYALSRYSSWSQSTSQSIFIILWFGVWNLYGIHNMSTKLLEIIDRILVWNSPQNSILLENFHLFHIQDEKPSLTSCIHHHKSLCWIMLSHSSFWNIAKPSNKANSIMKQVDIYDRQIFVYHDRVFKINNSRKHLFLLYDFVDHDQILTHVQHNVNHVRYQNNHCC